MFLSTLSSESVLDVSPLGEGKTLLIVDDDSQVRKMLFRLFKDNFKEVLLAATPRAAEEILSTCRVTHLISDYDLGDGGPAGTELISSWRRRFQTIETAVLLTGRNLKASDIPFGVDRYFHKGEAPEMLIQALRE